MALDDNGFQAQQAAEYVKGPDVSEAPFLLPNRVPPEKIPKPQPRRSLQMPKSAGTLDSLISAIRSSVQADLAQTLLPVVSKLNASVNELQAILAGAGTKKRGRPAGKGQGNKNPVAKVKPVRKSGKRIPQGALQSEIEKILNNAKGPVRLLDIQKTVMKKSAFKGRSPKGLYVQIVQTIKKINGVKKSHEGYRL